ncbi:MAG: efflux RND transporter periplasmic adaptor subunit [Prevotella sp.]|nr:efflux RND transporter periplasmic adaptor subunit [Bacteroides sp.]MCM1367026.1 efflux RND transporter periplasmic adaptor subunit [Prevotella sp.]MCM1437514.1 efflux RND transporter periplasmic adaptor subunit [Prevotella sp.]
MKRFKYILAIPLALTLLLAACGKDKKNEESKEDEIPAVKIATVQERDVNQLSEYTATVQAEKVNNISAQMAARIREIYVDDGMRVSKGQKLVVLDDVNATTYQLQVDNAKANLRNVQTDYNRALELYKIGGGTKQSVDQMETQLINAKNTLAQAERTLRNAAENTVLVSPINGVITARNYDPGDMTGQLPILTVSQVQPVKIVINVSESELSKVKKGMPAVVKFDTYGAEQFHGTITMVAPLVDEKTRTFGVEITVPNSDDRILPGMFGRVELNLGVSRHVVVPDRAVVKQTGSGNHYVYIYKDGKVSFVQVTLGQRLDDGYEILSGVPAGAAVVISGTNRLANGMEVKVIK